MPALPLEEIDQQDSQHRERDDRSHTAARLDDDECILGSQYLVALNERLHADQVQNRTRVFGGGELNRKHRGREQYRRKRQSKAQEKNRNPIGARRSPSTHAERETKEQSYQARKLKVGGDSEMSPTEESSGQ